jgi:hypothetical protein
MLMANHCYMPKLCPWTLTDSVPLLFENERVSALARS